MPEVDRVIGNREKLTLEGLAPEAWRTHCSGRHHGGARDRRPSDRTVTRPARAPSCRCRTAATTVAPSASSPSRGARAGVCRSAPSRPRCGRWWRPATARCVLSGVDLGHYGADLPGRPSLGEAVRRLLQAVPELPRLRLSSIDPVEVDPVLERILAEEPRLMPHLHLSVQAGDDLVLKRMKRRHRRGDVLALCEAVARAPAGDRLRRRPDRGLPLRDGRDVREHAAPDRGMPGLVWLHVFPYSPRPGTPAARMPQVPGPARRARAAALRSAAEGPPPALPGRSHRS